jgi:hypothetical protein
MFLGSVQLFVRGYKMPIFDIKQGFDFEFYDAATVTKDLFLLYKKLQASFSCVVRFFSSVL